MARPKIRMNYDPSEDPGIEFPADEGRTKQSFKDECDLNTILKRYEKTGQLPDLIKENPQYGDFSNVPEYQHALQIIERAETQFAAMDAHLRARFNNDPSEFLGFVTDPGNAKEMVTLGLAVERKTLSQATPVPADDLTRRDSTRKPKTAPSPASPISSDDESGAAGQHI